MKTRSHLHVLFARAIGTGCMLAMAVADAGAATYTWKGGQADNSAWGQATNWNGNVTPTFDLNADLVFCNAAGNPHLNSNCLGAARTIRSMTLNANVTGVFTTYLSTVDRTGNNILTFTNSPSITVSSAVSSAISLGGGLAKGGIRLGDNLSIAHHGSGNLFVERGITGATYTITKTGVGTLRLQVANDFAGLTVNGGWVRLGATESHGNGKGTLNLVAGTLSSDGTGARTFTNSTTIGGDVQIGAIGGQRGVLTFSGPVTLTGDRIVTNLSLNTISGAIGDGGGGYGLTKRGGTNLTCTGTNTYTGATKIEAGKLSLLASGHGGGAIAVSNGAVLGVSLVGVDTLRASSLTLGAGADGLTTNDLNVGGFGGLSVPVMHATNLTVNGTNVVNLSGVGFSVGQFPLITYGAAVNLTDASFTTGALPVGVSAYLTNNTINSSIDLVITAVPNLVWKAQTDTIWDTATTNWIDAVTSNDAAFFAGAIAIFDDGALTQSVSVASVVQPAVTLFNNVLSNYSLTGVGGIGGAGALILSGGGAVTLALASNSYAGGTLISNGTLVAASNNVIPEGTGKGNVLVDGALNLAGYSDGINGLSGGGVVSNGAASTTSHLGVCFATASSVFSGSFADGPAATAVLAVTKTNTGTLTLLGASTMHGKFAAQGGLVYGNNQALGLGPVDLNAITLATYGGARELTNSILLRSSAKNTFDTTAGDLTLWGAVAGIDNANAREWTKTGPNALRLGASASVWLASSEAFDINAGEVVVDGAPGTNSGNGLRLNASNDSLARLVITNGGSWVLQGGANLRLGYINRTAPATNVLDLDSGEFVFAGSTINAYVGDQSNSVSVVNHRGGAMRWTDPANVGGVRFASTANALGIYNLDGGTLTVARIYQVEAAGTGRFNFNGGTLTPFTPSNAAAFMQGLTEANVRDGGAVIDTAGIDITIAQPLLAAGSGGLTKDGAGTLTLTGSNTYTGATTVNQGALRLTTAQTGGGAIAVADGAALGVTVAAAGASLSASALTVGVSEATSLDLGLGAFGNPSAPPIAAAGLTANGTVTINVSGGPLTVGQYALIDYSGSIGGGGYTAFALGALPPGVQGVLVDNSGNSSVDLNVTNVASFVWTGAADGSWNIGATTNWTLLGSPAAYADGGRVRFDDTVIGPVSVVLVTALSPASVTVSSDSNYTFAGSGKISGVGGMAKDGGGTLTVSTTNDFTGAVTIAGGSLLVGATNALGATSSGTVVTNGGTLDVNARNLGAEPVVASGAGVGGQGAVVNNSGTSQQNALRNLTLAGDTTFGGAARWDARWAAAGDPVLQANGHKITKVGSNEVAIVGSSTNLTPTGMGDVDVQEGGFGLNLYADFGDPAKTLTLRTGTFFFMYNANTNILTKQVVMEDAARLETRANARDNTLDGTVTLNGTNYVSLSSATTVTVLSAVGGSGALATTNAGVLTLAGANAYAGPTIVRAGVLNVGADGNLGTPPGGPTPGNLALEGGTLRAPAGFALNANRGVALGPDGGPGTGTIEVVSGTVEYGGILADSPGGAGTLFKAGAGTLKLTSASTHSGGTRLNFGTLQVGHNDALGTGRLTLNGGTLSSDSATPRTLTNDLPITATVTLGDTVNSGKLTLGGAVDFGGAARSMTNNSEVLMTGITTNGRPQKRGPATLTLTGLGLWNGDSDVYDGACVLDGAVVTNNGPLRPNAEVPGGWARVAITNGAALVVTNTGGNLRAGYQAGDGSQTNFMEVAGTVRFPGATVANGRAILGAGSASGILNLWPGGDLEVSYAQSSDQTIKGESELNFRGGVLRPRANEANFIRTLTNAFVRDGGAIFDTQGFVITVNQPLLNGGAGGLEKRGAGSLTLTSNHTYVGWTTIAGGTLALSNNGSIAMSAGIDVQAGATASVAAVSGGFTLGAAQTLKGNGTVVGTATNAGLLTPGSSIGTLTFANDLALDATGTTVMEIQSPSNDQAAVAGTLTYGGALMVTNLGAALTTNDSFTLFTAAGFSGWFASLALPPVPDDTAWDTNQLRTNGILDVYAFSFSTQTLTTGKNTPAELSTSKLLQKAFSSRGTPALESVAAASAMTGSVAIVGTNIVYTPPTNYVGADSFTCVLSDGNGTITATVDVTVTNTDNVSGNILPLSLSGGNVLVRFMGIPGTNYILQSATNIVTPPVLWYNRVTNTAPTNGLMSFLDTTATNIYLQYYRTLVP